MSSSRSTRVTQTQWLTRAVRYIKWFCRLRRYKVYYKVYCKVVSLRWKLDPQKTCFISHFPKWTTIQNVSNFMGQ